MIVIKGVDHDYCAAGSVALTGVGYEVFFFSVSVVIGVFCNSYTNHLTLAQSASSTIIKANICILPAVMNASVMNTNRRKVNAASTKSKKVGCREEPGFRMSVKSRSEVEDNKCIMSQYLRRIEYMAVASLNNVSHLQIGNVIPALPTKDCASPFATPSLWTVMFHPAQHSTMIPGGISGIV